MQKTVKVKGSKKFKKIDLSEKWGFLKKGG